MQEAICSAAALVKAPTGPWEHLSRCRTNGRTWLVNRWKLLIMDYSWMHHLKSTFVHPKFARQFGYVATLIPCRPHLGMRTKCLPLAIGQEKCLAAWRKLKRICCTEMPNPGVLKVVLNMPFGHQDQNSVESLVVEVDTNFSRICSGI